jgi:hypothetical protein
VVGDHVYRGDGNPVVGRCGTRRHIRLLSDDFDVVADMRFQVNRATAEFEKLGCAILSDRVIPISGAKASFDAGLVRVTGRCGILSKPQHNQQSRNYDKQKHLFHKNPPKILDVWRFGMSLGSDRFDSQHRTRSRYAPVAGLG